MNFMKGFIYLIGEMNNSNNLYKIGMTRKKDINERIKELQTGNGQELYLIKSFKSNYPFKVEKMLHNHYNQFHENGEWFKLNNEQINEFLNECEKKENLCNILKDNPFFLNKKAST